MKYILFLLALFLIIGCKNESQKMETSSPMVETEDWVSILDSADFSHWDIKFSGYPLGHNYKNTFKMEEGVLSVNYDEYENFNEEFGHIYYKTPFSYYKVKFQYRFVGDQVTNGPAWALRNNGIMLHCQDPSTLGLDQDFPVSIEYQFLGGNGVDERATANLCTPGTIVDIDGELFVDHCINSSSKTFAGDQWVNAEALVYGDEKVIHIVEGDTVMQYTNLRIGNGGTKEELLNHWKNFGVNNPESWVDREGESLAKGYIAFQAESHPTEIKNVEVLDLCGCTDKKAKNYKSYYVKSDNSKCIY
ncbi:3-keto-disaccharide hydrolase [Aegicerativicinus sediminis]|uniref:3-keto-disaccharide hydrolase n=1 Tax=Aegicerativicinus sediminis TaxID=2893202 RepID=UPI001E490E08|nr:DUF1080 domain-containing protein [Aegicerativicinus sediminis]